MKKTFLILSLGLVGLVSSAFAETKTVMVSVNKVVPVAQAEEAARKLERLDPNMSACYFQSQVKQYISYSSCHSDSSCPYWGVAIVELDWQCSQSQTAVKSWLDSVTGNPVYTIYADGPIGPFPVVSGGN